MSGIKTTGFRLGNRLFTPKMVPTLATLILLPILVNLGLWQLDRADEKRTILAEYHERMQKPALMINDSLKDAVRLQYRKVIAGGVFDHDHQFLLDNRVHEGRVGYQVFTPLFITGSKVAVLVNRGWIPMGRDREHLPGIPTPDEEVSIHGTAGIASDSVFELDYDVAYSIGWPKVVQQVNPEDFAHMLHYPVLPFIVLQDENDAHGFARQWKAVSMSPERHTSYAVQWFALAAALVIIYLVVNIKPININLLESDNEE